MPCFLAVSVGVQILEPLISFRMKGAGSSTTSLIAISFEDESTWLTKSILYSPSSIALPGYALL